MFGFLKKKGGPPQLVPVRSWMDPARAGALDDYAMPRGYPLRGLATRYQSFWSGNQLPGVVVVQPVVWQHASIPSRTAVHGAMLRGNINPPPLPMQASQQQSSTPALGQPISMSM